MDAIRLPARPASAAHLSSLATPSTRPEPKKAEFPVGEIVVNTLIGAAGGGIAGHYGGTVGGVLGGLDGLYLGGRLGWRAGAALGMRTAERTGKGEINPVAGGIASLTLPLVGGGLGAAVGTVAGAVVGATCGPLVGAVVGGATAFTAEMVSWAARAHEAREAARQ